MIFLKGNQRNYTCAVSVGDRVHQQERRSKRSSAAVRDDGIDRQSRISV
jgi:hypothetical protein